MTDGDYDKLPPQQSKTLPRDLQFLIDGDHKHINW
jgi:hypothetical protein